MWNYKKKCSNRVFVWRERNTETSLPLWVHQWLNIRQLCIVCWILCFHSIVAVCYQYVDPLRLSVDVQSLSVRAKHHHILDAQPSHHFLSIRNKHLRSDTWACWWTVKRTCLHNGTKSRSPARFLFMTTAGGVKTFYTSCVWTKDYC